MEKKAKKICIITTIDLTLAQFVIPSARAMLKNGFEVTLVASMSDEFYMKYKHEFILVNVQMERGAKPMGMLKGILFFTKFFRNNKFDIIQYATPNAAFYCAIAGWWCKVPIRLYCQWGIRYVGLEGIKRRIFKFIEKITCVLSTHIRPASRKNLEFAVEEGLYPKQKAKVVGDGGAVGIDLELFDVNKKEANKAQVLIEQPSLKNNLILGFVGRIDKDKGISELIEAFTKIEYDRNNISLLIIGGGIENSGLSNATISQMQQNEKIVLLGSMNNVAKYMSAIDILIHPSYREGFSAVIQQAMALKVPVITTNIPGPSEVIEENVSGFLVVPRDPNDLFLGINSLIDDSERQEMYARNGYIRVKKLFTRERMTSLIIKDRQELLKI